MIKPRGSDDKAERGRAQAKMIQVTSKEQVGRKPTKGQEESKERTGNKETETRSEETVNVPSDARPPVNIRRAELPLLLPLPLAASA